ncbi:hypothetical protein V6N13_063949 [Hibiscus sabdariffa]
MGSGATVSHTTVAKMTDANGEWRWDVLQQFLPTHILLRIAVVRGPNSSLGEDTIGWSSSSDSCFSVKTAYDVQMPPNFGPHDIV